MALAIAALRWLHHYRGMARYIGLEIQSDMTDSEYTDLANTVWMLLRNTSHRFHVEHDGKTPAKSLNEAWDEYGADAHWD
jgi:hypothetical protein